MAPPLPSYSDPIVAPPPPLLLEHILHAISWIQDHKYNVTHTVQKDGHLEGLWGKDES